MARTPSEGLRSLVKDLFDDVPDPSGVTTVAEFVERLGELRSWAGMTYRKLERRAAASGDVLPYSTVFHALHRCRLPREELLLAFVRACGCGPDQVSVWVETRRRLAKNLMGDVVLGPPDDGPARRNDGVPTVVPAQLPHDTAGFVGREPELVRMRSSAHPMDAAFGEEPARIQVVSGVAGVGKTALALRFAHEIAHRFEGQLFANLGGFGALQPQPAKEVLEGFLRALGVRNIPPNLSERAGLFRSLLAKRRMLIVLDNAASSAQIRPLLPGAPGCLVIITSRNRLPGLVARDGAIPVQLDVLPEAEAAELLAHTVGHVRVAAESAEVTELVRLCGRLPLALRLIAERAVHQPCSKLGDLAGELADDGGRLDVLAAEDDDTVLRTAFSWSYRALSAEHARAFRLLALGTGADLSTQAAAALLDTTLRRTRRILYSLTNAHLIEQTAYDRYRFHDLVRIYAAERSRAEDAEQTRTEAVRRLLGWYVHSAAAASVALDPHQPRVWHPDPADPPPRFAGYQEALTWMEAERSNIVAAVRQAASLGLHRAAWQLAAACSYFFAITRRHVDWIATHEIGLASARHCGDHAEAWISNRLGLAYTMALRHDDAFDCHARAEKLFAELDDMTGEAANQYALATTYHNLGRCTEALDHGREALRLAGKLDDQWAINVTLLLLGEIYREAGRFEAAVECHHQALDDIRRAGHRYGEAATLHALAETYHRQGRTDEAIVFFNRALTIRREIGDGCGQAMTHQCLGVTLQNAGRFDEAVNHSQRALAILCDITGPLDQPTVTPHADLDAAGAENLIHGL